MGKIFTDVRQCALRCPMKGVDEKKRIQNCDV
jgi:hypothetical protein